VVVHALDILGPLASGFGLQIVVVRRAGGAGWDIESVHLGNWKFGIDYTY
jgi:hypothetical protein